MIRGLVEAERCRLDAEDVAVNIVTTALQRGCVEAMAVAVTTKATLDVDEEQRTTNVTLLEEHVTRTQLGPTAALRRLDSLQQQLQQAVAAREKKQTSAIESLKQRHQDRP